MSYAFLDVQIGKSPSNRIIIELFDRAAPETCRFFKSLLNHPHGYNGTRFNRVIEDFLIQGGDVKVEDDDSIEQTPTPMENSDHAFDERGLVGLAKTTATENNAQFFVTLISSPHLRGVHTIFGKVIKGMELADKIGRLEVDDADHPTPGNEVVIVGCGELQPRKPRIGRSRSPRPGVEGRRARSQSPKQRSTEHRRRSRSPEVEDEHHDQRQRHHHHHHHHHHRHLHRRHHRNPASGDGERRAHHNSRAKSTSPVKHRNSHNKDKQGEGLVPTGPRGYNSRSRYVLESNFGRLSSGVEYEDIRDDEDHLRAEERRREEARDKVEPAVIFKGRGAMKFRERNY
jgi:cyclophilin family peptidyl-prolyl cis-trans isomerase